MKRSITLFSFFLVGITAGYLSAQPGHYDPAFGEQGALSLPLYVNDVLQAALAEAVQVQPDGKILVAGRYDLIDPWAGEQVFLLRLDAQGQPDVSFGQQGWLTEGFGFGWRGMLPPCYLSDGSLLVAGYGSDSLAPNRTEIRMLKLLPNGQLDPSFGTQGRLYQPLGNAHADVLAMYLDSAGTLRLIGRDGDQGLVLMELSEQDSLVMRHRFDPLLESALSGVRLKAVHHQPDGKLLVAGETLPTLQYPNGDLILVRLEADFTPDLTFGQAGLAHLDLSPSVQTPITEGVSQVLVQLDGSILVAGSRRSHLGRTDLLLLRLQNDGTLDQSFGDGGAVYVPMHQPLFPADGVEATAQEMALQSDGKILLTAKWGPYQNEWPTAVLRFDAEGQLDPGFGQGGVVLGGHDSLAIQHTKLALQPDGQLVLAGTTEQRGSYDLSLHRLMTRLPQSTQVPSAEAPVQGLRIYPNPVGDAPFQLSYHLTEAQPAQVQLFDLTGRRLAQLQAVTSQPAGDQQVSIQLPAGLPSGHYLVQVITPEGRQTAHLLKR